MTTFRGRGPRQGLLLVLGLVACGALAACGGRGAQGPARTEGELAPILPWTTRFAGEAWVVARRVEIEGPNGLLNHVAAAQDPEHFTYRAEAVDGAYRQTWVRKPGAFGDLRVQLDGWAIVAQEHLVIVERLAEVPVVLRAAGEVSWFERDGPSEGQGAPMLEVVGLRPGKP